MLQVVIVHQVYLIFFNLINLMKILIILAMCNCTFINLALNKAAS